jgi:hypothetical protein
MKKIFKGKVYNALKFVFTFGVVFGAFAISSNAGIFDKANTFLKEIQDGLLLVSTVAAIVGVSTGVLMKKFSMGKQDKIETGNRIIRETLIAVAMINVAPVLVGWIATAST